MVIAQALLFPSLVLVACKPPKGSPIVCKLVGVPDSQSRQTAFTYFVPKGWTGHHNLQWAAEPGTLHIVISAETPDQRYEVVQMGSETYKYSYANGINGSPPMVVNSPVHHATEYLHVALDQITKATGATDVQVVDEVNAPLPAEKVPEWLKKAPVPAWETRTPTNETGYLQVKFTLADRSMTAMMGTTIMGFSSVNRFPGRDAIAGEGGFYTAGPTTFLIMPSDAPPEKLREMKVIASSIRMTPQFRQYMRNLTDKIIQTKMGAIKAGQKYADDTFHERTMAQFNQQMKMKDAYSHAFCNYVSDQQDYKDQTGQVVTAPASFRYAWSDGTGNYLFNDDPTVDMRGIGNGNWKQMEKASIGR